MKDCSKEKILNALDIIASKYWKIIRELTAGERRTNSNRKVSLI